MTESAFEPLRLVYGTVQEGDIFGVVLDAELAAKYGAIVNATTLGEYVAAGEWNGDWEGYVEDCVSGDNPVPSRDDPFDAGEWREGYGGQFPEEVGWERGSKVVERLVSEDPNGLNKISSGGASPSGNISSIDGPLDQLALIAERIDPKVDGVILERDDALVRFALPDAFYV